MTAGTRSRSRVATAVATPPRTNSTCAESSIAREPPPPPARESLATITTSYARAPQDIAPDRPTDRATRRRRVTARRPLNNQLLPRDRANRLSTFRTAAVAAARQTRRAKQRRPSQPPLEGPSTGWRRASSVRSGSAQPSPQFSAPRQASTSAASARRAGKAGQSEPPFEGPASRQKQVRATAPRRRQPPWLHLGLPRQTAPSVRSSGSGSGCCLARDPTAVRAWIHAGATLWSSLIRSSGDADSM